MTIHRKASVLALLLAAGTIGLSGCTSDASGPALNNETTTQDPAVESDTEPDSNADDGGFNKEAAVMMLETQLGTFGGTGRWEGETLIMKFDRELDGADGLDLKFVCGFMTGLLLEEHTAAVEAPSGTEECTV